MSCRQSGFPFVCCIFILRGIRFCKVIEHGIEVDKAAALAAVTVLEDFHLQFLSLAMLACSHLVFDKFTDSFVTGFFGFALLIVHAEILQADKNVTGILDSPDPLKLARLTGEK